MKRKLILFIAVYSMLLSPALLFSQAKFFEIAKLANSSYISDFALAVNPETSTIVLSYVLSAPKTTVQIVANTAKINKGGILKFSKKTTVLSSTSLNTEFGPSIVFHPVRKQFLVLWREASEKITDLDIGGRLLNNKGKPIGEPLVVISELYNQGFPFAVAYIGESADAPAGAAYFIVWLELDPPYTIKGQFFDSDVQPIDESRELGKLEENRMITSIVNTGKAEELMSIIGSGFDKDTKANTTTLSVFRFSLDSSGKSSSIILRKDETPVRLFTQLFASSDSGIILDTIRGEYGRGAIENFEIKNGAELGFKKKPYKVLRLEEARSQNIVQLDDGRIFQVVLTSGLYADIVVQEITNSGKPKGAPAIRIQPRNLNLLSSRAVALPGRNEILVVLSDYSTGAYILLGTVITIN